MKETSLSPSVKWEAFLAHSKMACSSRIKDQTLTGTRKDRDNKVGECGCEGGQQCPARGLRAQDVPRSC